jgi:single-strand DNA-binding protein
MSDTYVTLHGWVGGDVVLRKANGHSVLDLRVASTARFKRRGDWVEGDTTWYTVTVWRHLAENICRSVHSGDPVIVHGRLRTENFTRTNGEPGSKLVIDAALVGHDLSRGVSQFTRTSASDQEPHDGGANEGGGTGSDEPPGWAVPAADRQVSTVGDPNAA